MFEINTVTIILAIIIVVIALAYLLYKQVEDVSVLILNLLFPILILLSFYTLFVPSTFKIIADNTFSKTEFGITLKNTDQGLTELAKIPSNLVGNIQNIFDKSQDHTKPIISVDLYNTFITLIASIIRWGIFIISIFLILLILYLRYTFSSVFELRDLRREYRELKSKVDIMEQKMSIVHIQND